MVSGGRCKFPAKEAPPQDHSPALLRSFLKLLRVSFLAADVPFVIGSLWVQGVSHRSGILKQRFVCRRMCKRMADPPKLLLPEEIIAVKVNQTLL